MGHSGRAWPRQKGRLTAFRAESGFPPRAFPLVWSGVGMPKRTAGGGPVSCSDAPNPGMVWRGRAQPAAGSRPAPRAPGPKAFFGRFPWGERRSTAPPRFHEEARQRVPGNPCLVMPIGPPPTARSAARAAPRRLPHPPFACDASTRSARPQLLGVRASPHSRAAGHGMVRRGRSDPAAWPWPCTAPDHEEMHGHGKRLNNLKLETLS